MRYFNPRTLQESATVQSEHKIMRSKAHFNPRTLQESATRKPTTRPLMLIFQSTHPTRECDCHAVRYKGRLFYFNPRTLQESATRVCVCQPDNACGISIHAPYKRVRRVVIRLKPQSGSYFNPRTLQESATELCHQLNGTKSISIHAPYKRVRQA